MGNKNCNICLYKSVCEDRKSDITITDCCVPEKPLRRIQAMCMLYSYDIANRFTRATLDYVKAVKSESEYWSNT